MQDYYYERDKGIGNFYEWDSEINSLNAPRTGQSVDEN